MRKWLAALLSIVFFCTLPVVRAEELDLFPEASAPADEEAEAVALPPLATAPLVETLPLHPDCAAVLLVEQDSGQVILEMNADTPRPVASITKVMTILLTLEQLESGRLSLKDEITVSESAAGMGGSQVLLDVGERQSVQTLLKSMIVGSANDAAVALAEAMYGSEELCARAMNQRAQELGMTNTHFVNCTGLPAQGQHTTARDVAIMSRQVFAHEAYFDFSPVWMEDVVHGDGRITQLVNTNKLLRMYEGCDGGKTGSTKEAGYCVSATARRGDMRLIAVVLGALTGKERFAIARQLLDYGFAGYRRYPVARRGTKIRGQLPVTGGTEGGVDLMLDGELTLLIDKGSEQDIQLTPDLPPSLAAPVKAGQTVGQVRVRISGREVAQIPIAAARSVEGKGLGVGFRRIWENWVGRY